MEKFLEYLVSNQYLIWALTCIIGLIVLMIIIGFFQGRSFTLWPPEVGEKPHRPSAMPHRDVTTENESTLVEFPESEDELEDTIRSVWNEATKAESDRFWNILTLLNEINTTNNDVLLRLKRLPKSPYDVWKAESSRRSKSFKDVNDYILIAMKVISDVTRGDDKNSKRRGSIALKSQDDFLYVAIRDHPSRADESRERFFISDTSAESGIAGSVAYSRKSRRIPNVLNEPQFINFHSTPRYKSLLCVPIHVHDYVLGTFSIDSTAEDAYTQEEEALASIFANSIATALIALMLHHAGKS